MAESNKIEVELSVVDNMSAPIKQATDKVVNSVEKTNKSVKESKGAFSDLGKEIKDSFIGAIKGAVLAYAGFEIINKTKQFFVDARKEYQESVAAQNKLRAALGYTSQALNDQANALAEKLVVDNDEITAVQSAIANYVKSDEQIRKLTPAILDLAAATGMDMTSAANMVARAIADDNGELGKFKIAVEGATGSGERIDSVILGINKKMKDQAVAAAESKDWIDKLSLAWKDFQEGIGRDFGKKTIADQMAIMRETLLKDTQARIEGENVLTNEARAEMQRKLIEWDTQNAAIRAAALNDEAQANFEISLKATIKKNEEQAKKDEEAKRKAEAAQREHEAKISEIKAKEAKKYDAEVEARQSENAVKAAANEEWLNTNRVLSLTERIAIEKESGRQQNEDAETYKQQQQARATLGIQMAGQLFTTIASGNKRNAQEAKNIARVEAAINTAVAITKALPNPLTVGFAVAMGIAQQAAIANAKFATGTPYAPGGMSLVGENGPELMSVPRGAQIYNSTQTRNMVTNQGSMTINVMDNTGSLVDSMRRDIRSGAADQLINDILSKANRRI